ncbi:HAD family hydrolase [Streptomyces rectiverticillatus]|uniref:HAD-IA family hydrolase n=1 Tax=Streptomyces rectiverticillatus TaxID=173860 RepID=UPI0015C34C2B|nr:HAD-IA family hydrolase [Streptomyces rectiverticillatus]QLE75588.1 HAD family hydrolase [Streptomyces rectiverticillatus]
MTVRRFTAIDEVAAAMRGARALFEGSLEGSPDWLRAEEGRVSPSHHYLLAGDPGPARTAAALAACYPLPHTARHRAYASWEVLLGTPTETLARQLTAGPAREAALRRLAALRARLPVAATDTLAVVTPGSVRSGVLTGSADDADGTLHELVAGVEALAAECGAPVVEFCHVRAETADEPLHRVLRERGYAAVTTGADAVLDVTWPDVDAYFASFPGHRRRRLRKERERFLATAPEVRVQGPEGLTADLVALQLARYRAYGHDADARAVRDRFARAAQIPGLKVLRADRDGRPLGFIAFYEDRARRRITTRLGAFTREAGAYFNVAYYELVAHAARLGGMRIHYGDSTYAAKTGRGCELVRLTTYLRSADPALHRTLHDAVRLRTDLEEDEMCAAEGRTTRQGPQRRPQPQPQLQPQPKPQPRTRTRQGSGIQEGPEPAGTDRRRPEVVLFDAAGTLFSMHPSLPELIARRAANAGTPCSIEAVEQAVDTVGSTLGWPDDQPTHAERLQAWTEFTTLILKQAGVADGSAVLATPIARSVARAVVEPANYRLFLDVPAVLDRLAAAGIPVGIVSNFDDLLFEIHHHTGLHRWFRVVVTSYRTGISKPDPRIFHRALRTMGADPSRTCYVGDSVYSDMGGARAAGLQGILIDRAGAHAGYPGSRISTLRQLPGFLGLDSAGG